MIVHFVSLSPIGLWFHLVLMTMYGAVGKDSEYLFNFYIIILYLRQIDLPHCPGIFQFCSKNQLGFPENWHFDFCFCDIQGGFTKLIPPSLPGQRESATLLLWLLPINPIMLQVQSCSVKPDVRFFYMDSAKWTSAYSEHADFSNCGWQHSLLPWHTVRLVSLYLEYNAAHK